MLSEFSNQEKLSTHLSPPQPRRWGKGERQRDRDQGRNTKRNSMGRRSNLTVLCDLSSLKGQHIIMVTYSTNNTVICVPVPTEK